MRRKRLTKKNIEAAIKGSNGLISTIAQRLDVSRQTVRNYFKRYPELEENMNDELESILDVVESKLMKKVQEEESWAIKFYLQTKGKARGYGVCTISLRDEEVVARAYKEITEASDGELRKMIDG